METSLAIRPTTTVSSSHSRNSLHTTGRMRPTPDDWQRWKPMIMQRYKAIPARILVGEMNAGGLQVTEKMLRDRLRHWECKKNVRKAGGSNRRITAPVKFVSNNQSAREDQDHATYGELASLFRSARASLYSPLRIPKEQKSLRQTMKSVLDWQLHVEETGEGWDTILSNALQFGNQLNRMDVALYSLRRNLRQCSMPTGLAFRELHETSTKIEHSFRTGCTPLAMLWAMENVFRLREIRSSRQECTATSNFLLNKAAEALRLSDPALLLLRQMFLFEQTPETLAMIYEVGYIVFNSASDTSRVLQFRAVFIGSATVLGLGATLRPYIETLIDATGEQNAVAPRLLMELASLHYRGGHFDKCAQLARRCLDVLKVQGRENSWVAHWAWTCIANAQEARGDFVSEENALRTALTVAELIIPFRIRR